MTITAPAYNSFEGGTNGTAITAGPGNSGGLSGTPFDAIYGTSFTFSSAAGDFMSGSKGAVIAASGFGGGQWNLSSAPQCAANIGFNMKASATGDAFLCRLEDGTGRIFSVHVNAAGKLRVDDATGTAPGVFTFANALTPGQFYFVRLFTVPGAGTSDGVISVAYYVGTSQTPAETQFTTTTANLVGSVGSQRSYTIGRLGKLTASAEAYAVDQFGMDPTATGYMPFPTDVINLASPAMTLGEFAVAPAVTAGVGVTVVAVPASATSIGVPPVVSAEVDSVGSAFVGGYGWVPAPTVTTGTGVTVLAVPIGSSGSMPPPTVVAPTTALITPVMTFGAVGGIASPLVALTSTAAATLSGGGSLSASAMSTWTDVAGLSGSGVLTAGVKPTLTSPAALSGSGTLTASAVFTPVAGAALSGSGLLTGSGFPTTAAVLSGSGVLAVALTPSVSAAAILSGGGVLLAALQPGFPATAALSGSGLLSLGASSSQFGAASLSGVGTLAVAILVGASASATFTGVGTLTAVLVLRNIRLASIQWPVRFSVLSAMEE